MTDPDTRPWDNPTLVEAACDLADHVRELDLTALAGEVATIPAQTLAQLTLTLAAMVDVDRPLSELLAWDARRYPMCPAGVHEMRPGIATNPKPGSRSRPFCLRCRQARVHASQHLQETA